MTIHVEVINFPAVYVVLAIFVVIMVVRVIRWILDILP